jgi:hypothetical protein
MRLIHASVGAVSSIYAYAYVRRMSCRCEGLLRSLILAWICSQRRPINFGQSWGIAR